MGGTYSLENWSHVFASTHPPKLPVQTLSGQPIPTVKCPFIRAANPDSASSSDFEKSLAFLGTSVSSWVNVGNKTGSLQRWGGLKFDGVMDNGALDQVPLWSHPEDLLSTLEEGDLRAFLDGRAAKNGQGRIWYSDVAELKAKLCQIGGVGASCLLSNVETGLLMHMSNGGFDDDDESHPATVDGIMTSVYGTPDLKRIPVALNPWLSRAWHTSFNPVTPATDWPVTPASEQYPTPSKAL